MPVLKVCTVFWVQNKENFSNNREGWSPVGIMDRYAMSGRFKITVL